MNKILNLTKNLFNKIFSFFEDLSDKKAIKKTDFSKGKDFEKTIKKI